MSKQVDDWNQWAMSPEGQKRCDATTLKAPPESSHYLINRLQHTFNEAYRLGRLAEREEITRWLGMLMATRPELGQRGGA